MRRMAASRAPTAAASCSLPSGPRGSRMARSSWAAISSFIPRSRSWLRSVIGHLSLYVTALVVELLRLGSNPPALRFEGLLHQRVARMSDPSHPSSGRFRLIPPDCGKPSKFGLFRFSRLPAGAIVFRLLPPRSVMEPGDKPGDENANVGPAFRHLRAWPEAVGEVLRRRRSDVTGDAHQDQGHRHQSLAIPLSDRQPRAVYGARLGADRPSSGGARQSQRGAAD